MTPMEATRLCRFAKACCPQQAIDADTPDAWFILLQDIRFEDAQVALADVVRTQPFVAPAEIRAQVKKIRAKRLIEFENAHGPIPAPPRIEGADDTAPAANPHKDPYEAASRAYLADARRRIADGEVTHVEQLNAAVPGSGRRPLELEGVFRRVESA